MKDAPRIVARLAQRHAAESRRARWISQLGAVPRFIDFAIAPVSDLLLRLSIAQIFWVSGLLKLTDWDNALRLATYEYPVSWMSPGAAAALGLSIELIAPVFLALGLATRIAALPLLILSLVIQFEYRALNEHLWWALLFGWWMTRGAGGLSLDRWLSQGVGDSAIPGVRGLEMLFAHLRRYGAPLMQLLMRLAIASLVLAALAQSTGHGSLPSLLDPGELARLLSARTYLESAGTTTLQAAAALGPVGALAIFGLALCVALGFGTRIVAFALPTVLSLHLVAAELGDLAQVELLYLSALCLLLVMNGAGRLSLDAGLLQALRRRYPQIDGIAAGPAEDLPRVLIVGAGFGGIAVARGLRHTACRITLVDQHNYHLFQPLLYQVATAGLSPADIATPVRELFRDQPNVTVRMARVTGVDRKRRELVAGTQRIGYDYLVLATGARHSYFGKDRWEPFAPGLKRIEDATQVRSRLLSAFEQAENCEDADERERWLNFVIIGGGPTGVELAGAVAELARHGMHHEFRRIDPATARVILVQSGPRLLPAFDESLSAKTASVLRALGVEVRLDSRVEQVDARSVTISGQQLPARTVLWAAGVTASPAAEWLDAERDSAGRVKVREDLSVPGHAGVYAIGDTALSAAWNGQAVPGLAPAAKQGGMYVARVIRSQIEGRPPPPAFRYRHAGSLATIGRKAAVADFGRVRLSGPIAWWFWGAVHLLFLASLRSRVAVAIEWFWAYLTFRRSTRLITQDAAATGAT